MKTVAFHLRAFPIPSEAFVVEQARSLRRYRAIFLAREVLQPTPFDCLPLVPGLPPTLTRKLFAFAPGAWAWGGSKALSDVDLIHAHFGPNGAYALSTARQLRVPLVVTFHGFDATLRRSELLWRQGIYGLYYLLHQRQLKRRASKVIAVSRFLAEKLVQMGFSSNQIEQHYIGVDLQRFQPLPENLRTRDVVCVARLTRSKGIAELISAFASIAADLPDSKLRLIGSGPCRQEFELLANELGIKSRIIFEGTMPHAQVAGTVRRCALSVLASKTGADGWQEAFGLASIEAAAAGLPVIVSKHGGLPETVVNNETGLLVPEGNVGELAAAMLAIMRDDAGRVSMGRAGRHRVTELFDLTRQTAKLECIYDQAHVQ